MPRMPPRVISTSVSPRGVFPWSFLSFFNLSCERGEEQASAKPESSSIGLHICMISESAEMQDKKQVQQLRALQMIHCASNGSFHGHACCSGMFSASDALRSGDVDSSLMNASRLSGCEFFTAVSKARKPLMITTLV